MEQRFQTKPQATQREEAPGGARVRVGGKLGGHGNVLWSGSYLHHVCSRLPTALPCLQVALHEAFEGQAGLPTPTFEHFFDRKAT